MPRAADIRREGIRVVRDPGSQQVLETLSAVDG
jgi:hypothetical protein